MDQPITNDFSWSKSRHEKLAECLRAYHYHYYQSWGGWEDTAPPEVRQLYRLKKLSNRYTWAGSIVHASIRRILLSLQAGRDVRPEEFIEQAHWQMRQDFRFSRDKAYWHQRNRRGFSGLVEHEYAEPVTPEQWKQNWEVAKAALEGFFRSRWPTVAKGLSASQWLEVDNESFEDSVFYLQGVKVFAVPDFAFVDSDGSAVVVDWKTGQAREGYDEQVLGYALYLSSKYGYQPETIRTSLVYLNEGTEREVRVDAKAISRFLIHFQASVEAMRQLLKDPSTNVPLPQSAFPMTDDLAVCARCNFRRSCGREAASAQVA